MSDEANLAAMREALQAAIQSHVKMGKAQACDCSLCVQMRHALESGAGAHYTDRVREECAQIADWKARQCATELAAGTGLPTDPLKAAHKAALEIADRIRVLKGRTF